MFKKLILPTLMIIGLSTQLLAKNPVVKFMTNQGEIIIELFEQKAPITVENFLSYVKDGFYNGTIFHRVIPNFVIQGGGFKPGMVQKNTLPPIKNEATNMALN